MVPFSPSFSFSLAMVGCLLGCEFTRLTDFSLSPFFICFPPFGPFASGSSFAWIITLLIE